jgi:small subunit ribosomal protein S11
MAKKVKRDPVNSGRVYIESTFNNTRVTVTDIKGDVIAWSTAGLVGFSGSKQSTPFAAQSAIEDAISKSNEYQLKDVSVVLKGVGAAKEAALKTLASSSIHVNSIEYGTMFPFNGVRPPKRRRT